MYSDAAKAMFATNVCPAAAAAGFSGGTLPANCDPDWQFLQGGIRTMWTAGSGLLPRRRRVLHPGLDGFQGATSVTGTTGTIVGARPNGTYLLDDQGSFGAVFRAQRNFNAGD